MANPAKCPVDHNKIDQKDKESCPVDNSSSKSTWTRLFSSSSSVSSVVNPSSLSLSRETSSIPKPGGEGNWVYPSEAQFFSAMARKNHNPQAEDMKSIVPIHNAVNERAWAEVMKWEAGRGGEACGGVKLVNFKGRPSDMSPRARWKTLFGYSAPFDRHDWVVDRCGVRTRYVIDFYTGRSEGRSSMSFFLDVRPALDNWEGVKMRAERFWGDMFARLTSSNPSPPSQPVKSPS